MSKFTFFTILFSLIVTVIVGQFVLRDAIFPQEFKSQVLSDEAQSGPELDAEDVDTEDADTKDAEKLPLIEEEFEASSLEDSIFEEPQPETQTQTETRSFLTENRILQVGFQEVKNTEFSGKIFELFDLGKTNPLIINSFQINDEGSPVGVITETVFTDEISAQEFYALLQNKTKVYIDISVNETNSFGERSFFINHRKKPQEAFLVVRIREYVYSFAYVKSYHPRIKSLISLIYTDILS